MTAPLKTPLRAFAAALGDLIDGGHTSVRECAEVLGVSGQSIRNWVGDANGIFEEKAHALMRGHPSAHVRATLAAARVSGSEFHINSQAGETDHDQDGRTSEHDCVLAMSRTLREAGEQMEAMVCAHGDGRFSPDEVTQIITGLNSLQRRITETVGTVERATRGRVRLASA